MFLSNFGTRNTVNMSDEPLPTRCGQCSNGQKHSCLCNRQCSHKYFNGGHCPKQVQHCESCYIIDDRNGINYKILHCSTCGCDIYHPSKCPGSRGIRCLAIRTEEWGDNRRCPECCLFRLK